ncbi:MAG: AzlC family ABC transporter permease [Pseudomonadota bacterium]
MRIGLRSSTGYVISTFLFGALFGMAAAAAGFDFELALFMSFATFSASAQFVTLEFWHSPLPVGTIALSILLVSTRNILLGMSMAHHFDGHSMTRRLSWMFILNDPGVVTALRLEPGVDRLGYITGYGIALMSSWLISTAFGFLLARWFANVQLDAVSFAGPLVMTTMMILFAKGSNANPLPWWVSGAAALLLFEIGTPEYLLLPIAVMAGVIAGIVQQLWTAND